jgi:hypothetical protein
MVNSSVVEDRLVSRREAAGMLGFEPQTLAKWAMTGQHLPVVRVGRNVRYRTSDVHRVLAEGSTCQAI